MIKFYILSVFLGRTGGDGGKIVSSSGKGGHHTTPIADITRSGGVETFNSLSFTYLYLAIATYVVSLVTQGR